MLRWDRMMQCDKVWYDAMPCFSIFVLPYINFDFGFGAQKMLSLRNDPAFAQFRCIDGMKTGIKIHPRAGIEPRSHIWRTSVLPTHHPAMWEGQTVLRKKSMLRWDRMMQRDQVWYDAMPYFFLFYLTSTFDFDFGAPKMLSLREDPAFGDFDASG